MSIEQFPCPRCRRWIAGGASVLCLTMLGAYEIGQSCPGGHVCVSVATPVSVESPHIEVAVSSTGLSPGYMSMV